MVPMAGRVVVCTSNGCFATADSAQGSWGGECK